MSYPSLVLHDVTAIVVHPPIKNPDGAWTRHVRIEAKNYRGDPETLLLRLYNIKDEIGAVLLRGDLEEKKGA